MYIPTLFKKVLKFYLSLVKYIDQVSDFDINPKRKLFGLL